MQSLKKGILFSVEDYIHPAARIWVLPFEGDVCTSAREVVNLFHEILMLVIKV